MEQILFSEELVREFMETEENREYRKMNDSYSLLNEYYIIRQQIIKNQNTCFFKLLKIINNGAKTGNSQTDNQLELLNSMKVYYFLSNILKKQGYELHLFGGWLVRVLSGLNIMGGDLDLYVTPKISKTTIANILNYLTNKSKNSALGIKEYSLIFNSDNSYIKFGGSIDVDCYQIVFTNGIKCDLLTNRPDDSCVDFNINQLVFNGTSINRKVQTGTGCDWGSLFLGLYTRTGKTVKKYDKLTSLKNLEPYERHHIVQMIARHQKMLSKGLTITNFNPSIEPDGSIMIKCGHHYNLESLRKYVQHRDAEFSRCIHCRKPIVIRMNTS